MRARPMVVVAMSGGVDSSVAAALLQEQGYSVVGMMMRLWSEPGRQAYNHCCTPESMAAARRVAARLGIPFYAVDAQETFHEVVVNYFLDGYTQGTTPNPCLACNRHIRWEFLLQRALALGADYMATGHYARVQRAPGRPIKLLRAVDEAKDQSYVLSVLRQEQLQHALFPLGDHTKPEVRRLARRFDLPVAERPESQDLCFLAGEDYRDFLRRHAPHVERPGPIVTRGGETLGEHRGLAFYTIGQRKGLGVSAPHPLYVIAKDAVRNALVVGEREELGDGELTAAGVNWIAGGSPPEPFRAQVKVRYSARPEWGRVTPLEGAHAHVRFDRPLRAVTPGQAAVFYQEDEVLGGGLIEAEEPGAGKLPLTLSQEVIR